MNTTESYIATNIMENQIKINSLFLKREVEKRTVQAKRCVDQLQMILNRIDLARDRRNKLREADMDYSFIQHEIGVLKSMYNVFYYYVEVKQDEVHDISTQLYLMAERSVRAEA